MSQSGSSDIVSLVPSTSGLSQARPGNYIRALELIGVALLWIDITMKPSALSSVDPRVYWEDIADSALLFCALGRNDEWWDDPRRTCVVCVMTQCSRTHINNAPF